MSDGFTEDGPRREPLFNLPPVVTLLIAICLAIELAQSYVLSFGQNLGFTLRAAFIPVRYSGEFPLDVWAFTTPVTYSFLHGGFLHLGINMIWLAAFGSPLANRFGWLRFLVFWAVTSVAAAALHFALHPSELAPLVGASGAISGMMGAAARYGFRIDRSARKPTFRDPPLPIGTALSSRTVLTFLGIWMIVNFVTGIMMIGTDADNPIAWEAHIGGFLAGFFGVGLFDRGEREELVRS
jgi:membrane associated rhomboid family serine protease